MHATFTAVVTDGAAWPKPRLLLLIRATAIVTDGAAWRYCY